MEFQKLNYLASNYNFKNIQLVVMLPFLILLLTKEHMIKDLQMTMGPILFP